ncbi:MAG: hypothetical protein AB8U44_04315 [Aaplasma endosymbiont of Hyalomma asiaticum]
MAYLKDPTFDIRFLQTWRSIARQTDSVTSTNSSILDIRLLQTWQSITRLQDASYRYVECSSTQERKTSDSAALFNKEVLDVLKEVLLPMYDNAIFCVHLLHHLLLADIDIPCTVGNPANSLGSDRMLVSHVTDAVHRFLCRYMAHISDDPIILNMATQSSNTVSKFIHHLDDAVKKDCVEADSAHHSLATLVLEFASRDLCNIPEKELVNLYTSIIDSARALDREQSHMPQSGPSGTMHSVVVIVGIMEGCSLCERERTLSNYTFAFHP